MRRTLLALAGVLVVLAAAHTLTWRWAERRLETEFANWVAQRRALGWTVTYAKPISGGWPLAVELTVADLFLSGGEPDIPGGLTWSSDRVRLGVALLRPRALSVAVEGMQRLRLGEGPDIPFTADRFRAVVPLEPGVPVRAADIAAADLRVGVPAGEAPPHGLTVALLQFHADTRPAAPQGEPAVSFNAILSGIGLPPPGAGTWPLGPSIASVSFAGAVNGPLPRAPGLAARAAGWRDGGGTLELGRFAIGWGPLGLSGSATIALDERMQPMGAANAHIVGQSEALDALAANHAIGQRAATAAKAVLALMAKPTPDGGAAEVDVPLTLQGRTLAMGRIPLARLPELPWPTAP